MSIIIVTEKPTIARLLAPYARAHWPNEHLIVLSAMPYGNFTFSYPRGLSFQDYPRLAEPVIKMAPWSKWNPRLIDENGDLHPCAMTDAILQDAESVVCACDPDHTGAIAFATLVEQHFGAVDAREFPALVLNSVDAVSIQRAFASIGVFKDVFQKALGYGRAKRYFDWNWNVNALAILGATTRAVGVATDAPPLSKYSLQVLYLLDDSPLGFNINDLIGKMENWVGTGKHAGRVSLGSPASYVLILENLESAGLITPVIGDAKRAPFQITTLGRSLLAHLHKDCRDVDLPFRLNVWGSLGLAAAKESIDRYILTVFGKQSRFEKSTLIA